MKVLVAQLCPTLCKPMDCRLPGSSVRGILQARVLEWLALPVSRGSSQPGIKLRSPALQADSLLSEPPGKTSLIIALTPEMGKNYIMYPEHLEHYMFSKSSIKVNIISIYCLVGNSFEGVFLI